MTTLKEYHETIYPRLCNPEQSFLASPDFLVDACRLGSIIMIFLSCFALFLMLKKSPAAMKPAIPSMIHLQIWTMACDFMFSVMVLPILYLPLVTGHTFGVLNYIYVPSQFQFWLSFGALGGMLAAMMGSFEHRFRSIVSNSKFVMRRKSTRFIYNLIMYGYHINFGIPEILTMPDDQEQAKLDGLKILPCPPKEYFEEFTFVLQKDGHTLFNPHMYFTCASVSCILLFYCSQIILFLRPANNPSMSPATRKLQRNFFIVMCIQISVPLFVILMPNIYWNISITFQFNFQELNNLSVFFFTLHGISASIAIMTLYAPYRKYIKGIILKYVFRQKSAKNSAPISVIPMTTRASNRL